MTNSDKVKEFMLTSGQTIPEHPTIPDKKTTQLRVGLIQEELDELQEALDNNDLVEVADAIADILYVTYGAGLAFGMNIDEFVKEVHRSNMTKSTTDRQLAEQSIEQKYKDVGEIEEINGRFVIRHKDTRKILKPLCYEEPDLLTVVRNQTASNRF